MRPAAVAVPDVGLGGKQYSELGVRSWSCRHGRPDLPSKPAACHDTAIMTWLCVVVVVVVVVVQAKQRS